MRFWRSRTAVALILTIAALLVPCGAWYIAGSREVERTVAQIEDAPPRIATETAAQLSARLQGRLDALLVAESSRPFYHYLSLYHDPKGASEGVSIVPSPLAQGPADPFIRAYFQIDPAGHVTLPTLSDMGLEGEDVRKVAEQRDIQKDLQRAARVSSCVAYLQKGQPPELRAQFGSSLVSTQTVQASLTPQRYEVMESDTWRQNAQASKIYSDIKSGTNWTKEVSAKKGEQPKVSIGVGGFHWCSMLTSNGHSLVALRDVTTPEGILIQGFVISNDAVAESLKNAALPARFMPNAITGSYVTAAQLENTGWYIVVSAAKEFADAHARSRHSWLAFLQLFFAGAGAAAVAGLCVVALVWNTERLARQRSQFAASAAHELRTPLAGVRMYSEMLADGLGDPARAKDYAHRLTAEAARLGRVVSNVLSFTRLERGALTVRPERGDLAAVVRECIERQRPALEAAGAHVELSLEDKFPEVRFDRDAVTEIVQNLLDNAEKHTRATPNRLIQVTLAPTNDSVTLQVRDHGPGIPPNVRRRLFHPFTRGTHDDAPTGLGLGLVMIKGLVVAHGGHVSYSDAPGGGALFTVTLPQ